MKTLVFLSSLSILLASSAFANGSRGDASVIAQISTALGTKTLTCASSTDKVTLQVKSAGDLRMVARYAGNISGTLDSDNEGSGEECGGLTVEFNRQYSDYLLNDEYNDCEQGDWGYQVILNNDDIHSIRAGTQFTLKAFVRDDGQDNAGTRTLSCSTR